MNADWTMGTSKTEARKVVHPGCNLFKTFSDWNSNFNQLRLQRDRMCL